MQFGLLVLCIKHQTEKRTGQVPEHQISGTEHLLHHFQVRSIHRGHGAVEGWKQRSLLCALYAMFVTKKVLSITQNDIMSLCSHSSVVGSHCRHNQGDGSCPRGNKLSLYFITVMSQKSRGGGEIHHHTHSFMITKSKAGILVFRLNVRKAVGFNDRKISKNGHSHKRPL